MAATAWTRVRDDLRARGLRWTPQRRLILDALAAADGHVTGAELVDRCRARDADVTPSTVYRTLDVLEELGYVRHSHSATGREEYHVLPHAEHGHLECRGCGRTWELAGEAARVVAAAVGASHEFTVDVGHLTLSGVCADCEASPARSDGR